MQTQYLSNFEKELICTAAAPRGGSLNAKFMFKGTSPTNAWIDRPMNTLQLCCWQFSHKETL